MLTRKEIKDIQSLTQKKSRDALNLFVVEGMKSVQELIQHKPDIIQNIYGLGPQPAGVSSSLPYTAVTEIELGRLSNLESPNKVLAVVRKIKWPEPVPGKIVYLDGIQDPGNLGTIIRTADWFGLDAIVCSAETVDVYNSKVIQATMGSIFRLPVFYDVDRSWLRKQTTDIFVATMTGELHHSTAKVETGVLVIGNEGRGVSQDILGMSSRHITIARTGAAESLNASVAAGILMAGLF